MYPNLEAEMARKKLTRTQLAKSLNVSLNTLSNKLNGKSDISLPECLEIKRILGVNMTVDELFRSV